MLTDFLKDIKDLTGARKKVLDLLGCLSHIFSKKIRVKAEIKKRGKELVRESIVKSSEDTDVGMDLMALCHFTCREDLYVCHVLSNLDRGIT